MNIIFQQNCNKKQCSPAFSLVMFSTKVFDCHETFKNYRFGFGAKLEYIFNRKISRRRTRTNHINKCWYIYLPGIYLYLPRHIHILAKQLNFDLTFTQKCILACFLAFLLFVFQYFGKNSRLFANLSLQYC